MPTELFAATPDAPGGKADMTGQVVSADGGASIVSSVRPAGGWDTSAHDRGLYGTASGQLAAEPGRVPR